MRTITDNDRRGLSQALRHFTVQMTGQHTRFEDWPGLLDRALEQGITVDELLNRGNFMRASEAVPGLDAQTYVTLLTSSAIVVRPLKGEAGWDNDENMGTLSHCLREFFACAHTPGGAFQTESARANLRRLIQRNTLQGIFSDSLIGRVEEKGRYGSRTNVFQYVQELLWRQEEYGIDNSLTEGQEQRSRLVDEALEYMLPGRGEHRDGATASGDAGSDAGWPLTVSGETVPDEAADRAIYSAETSAGREAGAGACESQESGDRAWMPSQEDAAEGCTLAEDDPDSAAPTGDINMSMITPDSFKKNCVREAFLTLSVGEVTSLTSLAPPETSLDEFLTLLSGGSLDMTAGPVEARNAHQYLNEQLYRSYRECLTLQGVEPDEETLYRVDFLTASWDLRDDRTRRLQKLRDVIVRNGLTDDDDIMALLCDVESLYRE